jgi:hypothetical protein
MQCARGGGGGGERIQTTLVVRMRSVFAVSCTCLCTEMHAYMHACCVEGEARLDCCHVNILKARQQYLSSTFAMPLRT